MLNRFRSFIVRGMQGRNGPDSISRALFVPVIVALLVGSFSTGLLRAVMLLGAWTLLFYMYFRVFSRNISKRRAENARYEGKIRYLKTRLSQSREYRFYDCPQCGTHLRVPKGVGKITVTCKKCGNRFERKA